MGLNDLVNSVVASKLYDTYSEAETGGEKDKWIRTKVAPKGGSSAFGPVQITHDKLLDYVTRADQTGLSPESIDFAMSVMLPMQEKMLKYGGKDMQPGFEDYDYGRSGKFDPEKYGAQYKKLAEEMLLHDFQQAGGDINKMIPIWRGTANDKRYNKVILDKFNE